MVQLNLKAREMTLKLVFYGPALSGKTTNLQQIHNCLDEKYRGRLMTLDTKNDRTLFFDLLPVQMETKSGFTVKIKLFTVPGQVIHNSTRKLVLQGVDSVAFIADSQVDQWKNNLESFKNLRENLKANGIKPDKFPMVVQFNKRDLKNIIDFKEVKEIWSKKGIPVFPAAAINQDGVLETFSCLMKITFENLNKKYELEKKLGLKTDVFIQQMMSNFKK